MIYLDYQATTPLAPEALKAMLPWLEQGHANPHSPHRAGRQARAAVEVARDQVAALLPTGGRVVFTSGATEALNWAIKGVSGGIVTTAIEHAAVLDTARATGRPLTVLPVDGEGLVTPESMAEGTALVAAMLVNNEIGTIQPIAALAGHAHRVGAWMLCDAVQGYGRIAIPDGVDLVALSAHKIHGPKGIGALWIRDGITLPPLLHGGDQEGGRSGTLSPALCAGFGAAARLMATHAEADRVHVERLWTLAVERLGPDWTVNGSTTRRYHGNLNVRREGLDVARLMSDCRDIAFSAGSACASGSGRTSHVLTALGLNGAQAKSSIRLGFGRYTTEAELLQALDQLVTAAKVQRP
ncbi:cysteine desulfurase family protein [Sphingomonas sp. SORGH_AS_0879]|uniref:cysteine desulfurase family protein n=1 Tax=Sphingomonas sp. SORGH_AS_0879 TaxID=3041790 RepID=UPI00278B5C73|nr:cysteine desulfurase family protein [Sphingomonas sp. SORGH_AS_0879]MDQ1230213.1 cysteine desulfurase [Sphingomonas sp. SORGH_AS_0879]